MPGLGPQTTQAVLTSELPAPEARPVPEPTQPLHGCDLLCLSLGTWLWV